MDGNLVTIVYTWFICQMITMIWPIKWVSDSAYQSMCIIGLRLTHSSWVRESPRWHNILPIHEMARSFTSWSISAARSRVNVQPYKSLIYVTNPPSSGPRGSSGRNTYTTECVCEWVKQFGRSALHARLCLRGLCFCLVQYDWLIVIMISSSEFRNQKKNQKYLLFYNENVYLH